MFPHPSTVSLHNLIETHAWGATLYTLALPAIYHCAGSAHELLSTYTGLFRDNLSCCMCEQGLSLKTCKQPDRGREGLWEGMTKCFKQMTPQTVPPLQSQQVAHSTGETQVQTAATSCWAKTRHSACLFRLIWLLMYTHIILTTGVAMTCFNVPMESCFLLTLSRQTRNR